MSSVSNPSASGASYPSRPLPDERLDAPALDVPRRPIEDDYDLPEFEFQPIR